VRVADSSGAVVISVGYRRAPEHRFPAAVDDSYAVMVWAAEHAAELGIDPNRVAVGGHAAGAGLAAAVSLMARDQEGPSIQFQLLNEPELDDRQQTWSARHFTDTPFMTHGKVGASGGHEARDLKLLGRELVSGRGVPTTSGLAAGAQLPAGPRLPGRGAELLEQAERRAEMWASLDPASLASQPFPVQQPGRRLVER